jgi:cytochrome c5
LSLHWREVQMFIRPRQVQFETTAAEAERSAPNRAVAQEVEQNAEQAQGVAKQAALAAHVSQEQCVLHHADTYLIVNGVGNDW